MCDAVTPHVVVFADLSPRAKVQYTRFLLENDVKFHRRDSDRRFVANIQLVKPKAASPSTKTQPVDEVQLREGSPDLVDKRLAAIPEEFHAYANLIVLIGERPERPTASPNYTKETRLVRFLNEIYDARYEDLSASCMNGGESFAKFIRHHLTNHFGLKRLVDQQAWDLIEGLSALQHGKYPEPTLNFFLFARSRLQVKLQPD
ncbi:hypothetical protein PHYBOEH_003830 [Phytophthora boehmeriae]|uniref:Uncharacterized protein n=1 Tax=Phytophthora boehmeriae TaxID=109152 RepID=A0A8T1XAW7_9STRA|nr:hypothetical protein PHYBOEH_003830 [Phytophthora boehmeriae]